MWGNIFKFHYLSSLFAISCAFLFLAALLKIKLIFGQACLQTIFRLNPYSELVAVPCTEQIFPSFWAYFFFHFLFFNWLFSCVFIFFLMFRCSTVYTSWSSVSSSFVWQVCSCNHTVKQIKELVWARKMIFIFIGFYFFSLPSELSHLINVLLAPSVPGECSQSYFC